MSIEPCGNFGPCSEQQPCEHCVVMYEQHGLLCHRCASQWSGDPNIVGTTQPSQTPTVEDPNLAYAGTGQPRNRLHRPSGGMNQGPDAAANTPALPSYMGQTAPTWQREPWRGDQRNMQQGPTPAELMPPPPRPTEFMPPSQGMLFAECIPAPADFMPAPSGASTGVRSPSPGQIIVATSPAASASSSAQQATYAAQAKARRRLMLPKGQSKLERNMRMECATFGCIWELDEDGQARAARANSDTPDSQYAYCYICHNKMCLAAPGAEPACITPDCEGKADACRLYCIACTRNLIKMRKKHGIN